MTFNTSGLIRKTNRAGTVYYENDSGEIISKKCRKCGKRKAIALFNKNVRGVGGARPECKQCTSKVWETYYEQNRADVLRVKSARRKTHPEYDINYRRNNKKEKHTEKLNRRARVLGLENTLTTEHRREISSIFNEGCALTGSEYTWDHVIPISIGHGGTTNENMIPLQASLNFSKSNRNIFDWFADNRERFGLEQRRFDELITYLADINDMTAQEYEDYVRWCHDNPRTIDEIKAEKDEEAM